MLFFSIADAGFLFSERVFYLILFYHPISDESPRHGGLVFVFLFPLLSLFYNPS